jgi:hypothetical protein
MKRFSMLLSLALAASMLLSAGTPAHAAERPFYAAGAGAGFDDTLYGSGEATQLGRSRLNAGFVRQGDLDVGIFRPLGDPHFTAANGDELYFDFDADLYFFDTETGVVSATVTFTGGNGRFDGATGTAVVTLGLMYLGNGIYAFGFWFEGSIDY